MDIKRMWIDQPSALQPHHELHGTRVLVTHDGGNYGRVYFLDGDTISMRMSYLCLSPGWPRKES